MFASALGFLRLGEQIPEPLFRFLGRRLQVSRNHPHACRDQSLVGWLGNLHLLLGQLGDVKSELGGGIWIGTESLEDGQAGDVEVLPFGQIGGDLGEGLDLLGWDFFHAENYRGEPQMKKAALGECPGRPMEPSSTRDAEASARFIGRTLALAALLLPSPLIH